MDYSYIFYSAVPVYEKFIEFGFEKQGDSYVCKKELSATGFYTVLTVSGQTLRAEVFENGTDEKYVLFDVKNANGSFVSDLREQVKNIVEQFRHSCFKTDSLHEKYIRFLESEFNCKADFPWEDSPDYAVFRCPNNKWFALVMNITYKNLGFESEEKVFVVNLKADSDRINEIVDRKSVFPAWHMNKKYWITVLLTSVTDFEQLCTLTKRSRELVRLKK